MSPDVFWKMSPPEFILAYLGHLDSIGVKVEDLEPTDYSAIEQVYKDKLRKDRDGNR